MKKRIIPVQIKITAKQKQWLKKLSDALYNAGWYTYSIYLDKIINNLPKYNNSLNQKSKKRLIRLSLDIYEEGWYAESILLGEIIHSYEHIHIDTKKFKKQYVTDGSCKECTFSWKNKCLLIHVNQLDNIPNCWDDKGDFVWKT